MAIKGVDHIVVRVKDIDEGIATYRDTLGMELERTAESEAIGIKQAFFRSLTAAFSKSLRRLALRRRSGERSRAVARESIPWPWRWTISSRP